MTAVMRAPDQFMQVCGALGFELSADELERLAQYLHLLLETNKQFNLTAVRDPDEAWMRHILDSLSLLPFTSEARTLIDVGSGGGLPGLVLAIAQPQLKLTLLEATGKKARFLEQAARELALDHVRVLNDRAEAAGRHREHRDAYDLAVGRAVGPLNVMLEYMLPFVTVGGQALAMKGRRVEQELRDAGDALTLLGGGEINVYDALPGISEDAVIVEIHKERPTPGAYPRLPGVPKKEPL